MHPLPTRLGGQEAAKTRKRRKTGQAEGNPPDRIHHYGLPTPHSNSPYFSKNKARERRTETLFHKELGMQVRKCTVFAPTQCFWQRAGMWDGSPSSWPSPPWRRYGQRMVLVLRRGVRQVQLTPFPRKQWRIHPLPPRAEAVAKVDRGEGGVRPRLSNYRLPSRGVHGRKTDALKTIDLWGCRWQFFFHEQAQLGLEYSSGSARASNTGPLPRLHIALVMGVVVCVVAASCMVKDRRCAYGL